MLKCKICGEPITGGALCKTCFIENYGEEALNWVDAVEPLDKLADKVEGKFMSGVVKVDDECTWHIPIVNLTVSFNRNSELTRVDDALLGRIPMPPSLADVHRCDFPLRL